MMERLQLVCGSAETTMMTNSVANNSNPFGAVDYQVHRQTLLDTGLQILEYDRVYPITANASVSVTG